MKTVSLATFVLAGLSTASAQDAMQEKLEKKLQSPFLSKAAWITDYDKAREESKKSGKLIFAYFTRSYAN